MACGCAVVTGRSWPSLLCYILAMGLLMPGPVVIIVYLIMEYNSLNPMMKHHRLHDYSTWGPHMHACRLHHQFWPPQSTTTISAGRCTSEHHHLHVRTASLITIMTTALMHALPPQHVSAATRTHARDLVSVRNSSARIGF
jgi:hypothetical protein